MSKSKFKKLVQSVFKQLGILYKTLLRGVKKILLRGRMANNRRGRLSTAGFVLPTVSMVMLVVVLLTIAILLRSFQRAENAQQFRVDQATLSAVSPGLDRGIAKVDDLVLRTQEQFKQTPTDENLYSVLSTDRYTFDDEERLTIEDDVNDDGSIAPADNDGIIENDEQLNTAWRFPVDTDNDGENDTYILYGIYFRNPTREREAGEFDRERDDLDARITPMPPLTKPECQSLLATSTRQVGDSGWYLSDSKLKKSFFVYAVSVPIGGGNGATTPLEYQRDVTRVPLTSNAVVYADDLEIAPSPEFRLNGAILANSNFMVTPNEEDMRFYLISGKNSCLYKVEDSKITVGGNVFNGTIVRSDRQNQVDIDLFKPDNPGQAQITSTNQSVTGNTSFDVASNDEAYATLIDAMVDQHIIADPDGINDPSSIRSDLPREGQLEDYFKKLTRKIPFAEVPLGTEVVDPENPPTLITGSVDTLRPIEEWTTPVNDDSDQSQTGLNLNPNQLKATPTPDGKQSDLTEEKELGDRVLVGLNQPEIEIDDDTGFKTTPEITLGEWGEDNTERPRPSQVQTLPSVTTTERDGDWEIFSGTMPEAAPDGLGGLRVVTGAGVYERVNSFLAPPPIEEYNDPNTADAEEFPVVWPDTMSMSPSETSIVYNNDAGSWESDSLKVLIGGWPLTTTNSSPVADSIDPNTPKYAKGDLRMRASAVYHYAQNGFSKEEAPNQNPIACVSSYYDPTNIDTAKNDGGSGDPANPVFPKSNNGISYAPPPARPGPSGTPGADGRIGGGSPTALENQANLVFPDGRFVNPTLRRALLKPEPPANLVDFDPEVHRTLSEQAAIDATQCALGILDGSLTTNDVIPERAIEEVTLLDARQIKAISEDPDSTRYDLPLEERQPLEIRLTKLDLDELRKKTISYTETPTIGNLNPEYLLPYSGIIYASRDDAVPDQSNIDFTTIDRNDPESLKQFTETDLVSPTDFQLDPNRRPNGIMLFNGEFLARGDSEDGATVQEDIDAEKEKGLLLISNLPVYIQGEFNPHTEQEFQEELATDWGNFYTREDINPNFACHKDGREDAECTEGDTWRPATVMADAVTLLSDNFRLGYRNEGDFDLRRNIDGIAVTGGAGYDLDQNGTIGVAASLTEDNISISFNNDTDTDDEIDFVGEFDLDGDGIIGTTPVNEGSIVAVPVELARKLNGFTDNNFVTNGLSSQAKLDTDEDGDIDTDDEYTDADYVATQGDGINSSYFNNFVTPIQRRGEFPEYVMEICRKLPVSACEPGDWVVGISTDNTFDSGEDQKASKIPTGTPFDQLLSGTTASPPLDPNDQRFPRRVAFLRDTNNNDQLILDTTNGNPVMIGINGSAGQVEYYSYDDSTGLPTDINEFTGITYTNYATTKPRLRPNALWFKTDSDNSNDKTGNWGRNHPLWYENQFAAGATTTQQPILVPVLQIYTTTKTPAGNTNAEPASNSIGGAGGKTVLETKWIPRATETTYNLVTVAGDTPARPPGQGETRGETNGGLQNLPRFLENWQMPQEITTNILGAFVQLFKSAYATAPYIQLQNPPTNESIFGYTTTQYNINSGSGRIAFQGPPARNWGYDVGLRFQYPDLFAQKFTIPDKKDPDEFFREVGLDDSSVEALYCAKLEDGNYAVTDDATKPNEDCF